jgi:AraC-like DNA-binding protein
MDNAVERAIEYIRQRYGEPLTLAGIADSAMLSRFHFTRLFKKETGLTPGRFLAAVRIHHAKRLIDTTTLSIIEISYEVGYNSVGSFTNSFTASVGVPPGRFRRLSRDGARGLPAPPARPRSGYGTVAGTISLPEGYGNARVYLGAFCTPVVQHPSLAAIVVDVPSGRPVCYSLKYVPEGKWHLLAVAVADGIGPDPQARRTALVGGHGRPTATVAVTDDSVTSAAVRLRLRTPADPPILLALPELEPPATFMARPGCASVAPDTDAGRHQGAGHLRVASPAPVPGT